MLTFTDAASIAASPAVPADPRLQKLLAERVEQWASTDVLDLTEVLIVEPGDTAKDIWRESTICPLVNPLDGSRFGSDAFTPFWESLERREAFYELIVTVGNSGFAYVILIADAEGADPALLALCRTYAGVQP
ncbi:MAG TPA: hypothetical protein VEZ41_04385 [Allosphingosinicella sp.]|nr:hypothetical protein [Allosphingosinicella sp.]